MDAFHQVVERGGKVSQAMQAFERLLGGSDMLGYLSMMAHRLVELWRVLKPTGSIYLHCDPTASHYLKLLMDAVFQPANFLNEVVWQRTNARSTRGRWPRVHDILLYYRKGLQPTFRSLLVPAARTKLPHTLVTGPDGKKYQTFELTGQGTVLVGQSGTPWRGFDPGIYGRHWANAEEVREAWDAEGLIHWPSDEGFPRRRASTPFDEASRVVTVGDVRVDIDRINQAAKERLGYPTQKPVALLKRIIQASSREGETVLDLFCGCGTTIDAAQGLKREWIGIDITYLAIALIKHRLQDTFRTQVHYRVRGEPTSLPDAEALAAEDRYQFQWWALGLVGARPIEQRRGADQGIDGRLFFHDEGRYSRTKQVILSVKSGTVSVRDVRDLRGVVERERAEIGVLMSLRDPTLPMRREVASAGFYTSSWGRHARLQILTIADLFEARGIDYPGWINVTFRSAPRVRPREYENLEMPLERL